jgi:hypothetical protein
LERRLWSWWEAPTSPSSRCPSIVGWVEGGAEKWQRNSACMITGMIPCPWRGMPVIIWASMSVWMHTRRQDQQTVGCWKKVTQGVTMSLTIMLLLTRN